MWFLRQRAGSPHNPGPLADVRVLTEGGKATRAAASPDGRYVVYVTKDQGKFELRLLQVATDRDVRLLAGLPTRIHALHFSPDGNFVYFLRDLGPEKPEARGVFRIAALGGPATPLASDARGYGVSVSPDGRQVVYVAQTDTESVIAALDPDGGNRRILARRPLERPFWFAEWSPSGEDLAAVAVGDDDLGVLTIQVASGAIRNLSVTGWGSLGQPVWAPDGATIYAPGSRQDDAMAVGNQLWALDVRTGSYRRITSNSSGYNQWSLSLTATGDLIAITWTTEASVWVTDRAGRSHVSPVGKGNDS